MVKCSFCGTDIPQGTGRMYVKADGKIFYFCKSKCHKNMIGLKRKPRTTTWTAEYKKEKSQRLSFGQGAKVKSTKTKAKK